MGKSTHSGPIALNGLRSHPKHGLASDPRHTTSDLKVRPRDEKSYTTAELWDVPEYRSTVGSDSTAVDVHVARDDLEAGSQINAGANMGAVAREAVWARDFGGEDAQRAAVCVRASGWPGTAGHGEEGKVLDIA